MATVVVLAAEPVVALAVATVVALAAALAAEPVVALAAALAVVLVAALARPPAPWSLARLQPTWAAPSAMSVQLSVASAPPLAAFQ